MGQQCRCSERRMETQIRRAYPNETKKCDEVLRSAFRGLVRRLGRELSDASFASLAKAIEHEKVMVATHGGSIVGVAVFSDKDISRTIEHVGVDTQVQGNGIGSKILQAIERDAFASGISTLRLDTVEFATELVQLYTRLGFKVVSKGLPKHHRDNHLRVFMEKNTSPRAI